MQIIIVGCGNVGQTLVEQLSEEGHNITVIEEQSSVLQTVVNNYDVMGLVGNGTSFQIMKDAGIEKNINLVYQIPLLNILCHLQILGSTSHGNNVVSTESDCYTITELRT